MWVDLPPITSADIWSEFQKPQAQEVVSVWECKSPDFQKQFNELQSQTKEKTVKLQEEMQYSEKQKEVLRKIYQSLWEENPELKKSIETQSVKIFEVPNRDLVALSIDWKNVDYLYDLEWKEYFDFRWRRNDEMRYAAYKWLLADWINEKEQNWIYYIEKNNKKLNSFSEEWLIEYSDIAQHLINVTNWLEEVWKMDWNKILEEKIISYYSDWFDNWVFKDTKALFNTDYLELKVVKNYINESKNYVIIDSKYIDVSKIDTWFENEIWNVPTYNTYF